MRSWSNQQLCSRTITHLRLDNSCKSCLLESVTWHEDRELMISLDGKSTQFVVLATDGLWADMISKEVVSYICHVRALSPRRHSDKTNHSMKNSQVSCHRRATTRNCRQCCNKQVSLLRWCGMGNLDNAFVVNLLRLLYFDSSFTRILFPSFQKLLEVFRFKWQITSLSVTYVKSNLGVPIFLQHVILPTKVTVEIPGLFMSSIYHVRWCKP